MDDALDPFDRRLLDDWQRDFPLVPRPFAELAARLWTGERHVLERLAALKARALFTRVGATVAPNTVSASTLAAVAAPADRVQATAEAIGAQAGVNHSYLREDDWNLWFVVTGPDRAHVDATLARIAARTELRVLDLPLVRPFTLDLGFPLSGGAVPARRREPDPDLILAPEDRAILQGLTDGLDLVAEPYAALGTRLELSEAQVLARIARLCEAGVIARLGLILRHRALGWRANAMVVWQLDDAAAAAAGPRLAEQPGVTLCYQRRPAPDAWPYTLYAMIHARSRSDAMETLAHAQPAAGLDTAPRRILFSLHCYKQRGALIGAPAPAREATP